MDDFRFYDYASSTKQIVEDMLGSPKAVSAGGGNAGQGAVGYWKFDEGSGTSTQDSSGNANTGTLTNGPTWTSGKIGKGLSFDGTDDYMSAADSTSLRVESGNFTVSVWVKPSVVQQQAILFKGNPAMSSGYILVMNRNGSDITLTKGGVIDQAVSYTFQANNWYHIVAVQPLAGNVTYYINGQSIGSFSNTSAYISSSGQAFYIGDADTYFANKFSGQIDDVKIFNYALTTTQVKTEYNQNAAVRFGPNTGSL